MNSLMSNHCVSVIMKKDVLSQLPSKFCTVLVLDANSSLTLININ